ncbi:WD40/YVTN/BNR-like repeat-containing protein [Pelomonas sp. BJYL3]|uniref:WD40/YVTN/BNR-like repeat-containing protein n=1 Tax=Pelomonas sp. BJYL3 TaxID=2976697 RepID=UPI0022B354A0|nr:hypothetical protein [Pelomonas sp. BJYL3]
MKSDLLPIDEYKKRFAGFGVRDCAVVRKGVYYFVLLQDWDDAKPRPFEEELEARLVRLMPEDTPVWIMHYLSGFGGLMCSGAATKRDFCCCVDRIGQVFRADLHAGEMESSIPGGKGKGPSRGVVDKIKPLNGFLYGCGDPRSVFKRTGVNQWQEIGPLPPAGKGEVGFRDFDGFSESDIYATGGRGDVWHYDGHAWSKISFPSNMWLESVCCGQDGFVYIGAQSGTVFRGRGDQWKLIHKGDLSLAFKDMVWFGDRVYATNDYGLWEIQGESVQRSNEPIEITNCAGNLSVADGVMLMAGAYGAALHDGRSWTRLFSLADLAKQARSA